MKFSSLKLWKALANQISLSSKIFLGEVGVSEYGEKENEELIERFSILPETFPQFRLFKAGQPSLQPIIFNETEVKVHTLDLFLRSHGLWTGLEGCLEEFDLLADEFMRSKDDATRTKVIEKANHLLPSLTNKTQIKSANYYLKVMTNIVTQGKDFVTSELARLQKLIKEKKKTLSYDNSSWFQSRCNILQSFSVSGQKDSH
ncbi:Endoplasmic reticulum protein ERp29 [Reticulomyxa filosa]|uniref:Endoplasmic reticulum protein ERp29 n=1 Tax=Reticulomyxa filosa TaxID=46433 RepID=X6MKP4_RETFI|nr:Endoplasmic reticulum protein ERp29 [Reticulomyxa filosa]|eukprot:ETO14216.1 Endoplasmic reticulum protein ERp29 [Reticulomyxa filosa]